MIHRLAAFTARRLAVGCTIVGLMCATSVVAQPAGMGVARGSRLNETMIEDLDELDPPYKAYTGIDYRPGQKPAPKVMVKDVVSIFVEDPLECAVRCNDDDLCNSAAFYGNNPVGSWPKGFTCLLRVISVPCEVPKDYEDAEQPKTILLVALDEDCEEPTTIIPLAPIGGPPDFSGPLEAPLMVSPLDAEPLEAGPMMSPMVGPADGPDGVIAPAVASIGAMPAAEPMADPAPAPPATSTVPPSGLIRNFDVTTAPNVPVDPTPNAPPTPPPSPDDDSDAAGPAAEPAGVGGDEDDDYFELGAQTPGVPQPFTGESSGAVGLGALLSVLATMAAVLCLLA